MCSHSCGMESCTHILQFALLCVGLLGGLAVVSSVLYGFMDVFIPYLWSILSAVLDNPSTYGMTANALLSCADLFLLFVCRPIVFFLFRHRSCFTLSKIYFGYPQLFNAFLMCTSSLSLSSSVDTSISFLSINVLTTPDL